MAHRVSSSVRSLDFEAVAGHGTYMRTAAWATPPCVSVLTSMPTTVTAAAVDASGCIRDMTSSENAREWGRLQTTATRGARFGHSRTKHLRDAPCGPPHEPCTSRRLKCGFGFRSACSPSLYASRTPQSTGTPVLFTGLVLDAHATSLPPRSSRSTSLALPSTWLPTWESQTCRENAPPHGARHESAHVTSTAQYEASCSTEPPVIATTPAAARRSSRSEWALNSACSRSRRSRSAPPQGIRSGHERGHGQRTDGADGAPMSFFKHINRFLALLSCGNPVYTYGIPAHPASAAAACKQSTSCWCRG